MFASPMDEQNLRQHQFISSIVIVFIIAISFIVIIVIVIVNAFVTSNNSSAFSEIRLRKLILEQILLADE